MDQPADQNQMGNQPPVVLPADANQPAATATHYPSSAFDLPRTPASDNQQNTGFQTLPPMAQDDAYVVNEPNLTTPSTNDSGGAQSVAETPHTTDVAQMGGNSKNQVDYQQYTSAADTQETNVIGSANGQQQHTQMTASNDSAPPPQPTSYGTGDKERVEFGGRASESVPLVELKEDHEFGPEVEGWLEKLEKGEEVKLPQPVTTDDGQVIVADAGTQVVEERLVLPMSESELDAGLKAKVSQSARWLAVWCQRIIKKMGDQTAFRHSGD